MSKHPQRGRGRPPIPTIHAYAELRLAYDHFNRDLFGRRLPPCLITLQPRDRRIAGYFCRDRFGSNARLGETTHEIAMNPRHFRTRNTVEVLQTLAHEMCHLWQQVYGRPSRGGYHNHEWAKQMQAIGLMPSSTGRQGGKIVGQHMGDYPIAGGPFERAAKTLLDGGFKLTWYDRIDELAAELAAEQGLVPAPGAPGTAGPAQPDSPAPRPQTRAKFTCPGCRLNAWAKPAAKLVCGDCSTVMAAKATNGQAATAQEARPLPS